MLIEQAVEHPQRKSSTAARQTVVRVLLFVWTLLVACPIRYWAIDDTVDNTWVFALNFGAAHGLSLGRDLIWTTGPLGYLTFPMNIGTNLTEGLLFQCAVWGALIAIFADLFFRAGLRIRNLTYFSIFFALSAPLYWFNYMGIENLLIAGVLVLLCVNRHCGGRSRYIGALALAGVVPLIKLTGGLLVACAIAGFLIDRAFHQRKKLWIDTALAVLVPFSVAATVCWLFLPNFDAFTQYVHGSWEIAAGYSSAMSTSGDPMELAGVAETLIGVGALLFFGNKEKRSSAWFLTSLLTLPLLISFKHGFVRQELPDIHVLNFFTFAGLALAVSSLFLPLGGKRSIVGFLVLLNFGVISFEYMFTRLDAKEAVSESIGARGVMMALRACHSATLRAELSAPSSSIQRLSEARFGAAVGDASVASLSVVYGELAHGRFDLRIPPVPQRYSAYTAFLDQRNAAWIRNQGPQFLLFDGFAIDHRDPWAETPAMWLEVYRWYDTHIRSPESLLLIRRKSPRFTRLRTRAQFSTRFSEGFEIPSSESPLWWTLDCRLNTKGTLENLLLRVPEIFMNTNRGSVSRVIPGVLSSPVMGTFAPSGLDEFASLMSPVNNERGTAVTRVRFFGPGINAYQATCKGSFLTTEP